MNTLRPRIERAVGLAGAIAAGGVLAAALAACGAGGGGGGETSPSAASPSTAVEPTEPEVTDMPDETPYLDPSMGTGSSDAKAEMTITGTVEAGVESGCLVMTYEGTVYGIFGRFDESIVHAGAEVTLHGHLDPGMMSFCQQGTPFVVEEAESAG
jgi:hypothetical protein